MTAGAAISAVITRCFSMRPADRGARDTSHGRRPKRRWRCAKRFERVGQTDFVELRPVRVREIQFAVREIPQQKVADALVAAGANAQIRRRQIAERQQSADGMFVDLVGIDLARADGLRETRASPA